MKLHKLIYSFQDFSFDHLTHHFEPGFVQAAKNIDKNKKLDLWKLPDILVFHLKRFTYSIYLKNKNDIFVNFPIHDLDLSKYVRNKNGQSYMYELYDFSNHCGGLGGGHYTAYAKVCDLIDLTFYFVCFYLCICINAS